MSVTTIERQLTTPVKPGVRARLRRLLVVCSDLLAIGIGLAGARSISGPLAPSVLIAVGFGLSMLVGMAALQLYSSRQVTDRRQELTRVWRSGVWALLVVGAGAIPAGLSLDLGAAITVVACTTGVVAVERELLRAWFSARREAGHGLWSTVLVARPTEGAELRRAIDENRTSPHVIVDQLDPAECATPEELLTKAVAMARAATAFGVVVDESSLDRPRANRLVRGLLDAGLYVDLASPLADIATNRLATRNLGPTVATWIAPRPRSGWRAVAKRSFDLVVAFTALALLAPVFFMVALAVKLTSPGPVFFRQERVGRDGEPFDMLKFRSMVSNAEDLRDRLAAENEGAGPLFKMKSDPRVTRVGRIIRMTSLDELPQLINVLRNEMSLVGPRPALRSEMAAWAPDLYARLQVKPGITGMWQVSGRSGTSFAEYTRLDLYYVHNWSLLVDLSILVRTIPAVIRSDGAF